ncbi:hypothetical protein GCM10027569_82480 [Flindersiella endophytica]
MPAVGGRLAAGSRPVPDPARSGRSPVLPEPMGPTLLNFTIRLCDHVLVASEYGVMGMDRIALARSIRSGLALFRRFGRS